MFQKLDFFLKIIYHIYLSLNVFQVSDYVVSVCIKYQGVVFKYQVLKKSIVNFKYVLKIYSLVMFYTHTHVVYSNKLVISWGKVDYYTLIFYHLYSSLGLLLKKMVISSLQFCIYSSLIENYTLFVILWFFYSQVITNPCNVHLYVSGMFNVYLQEVMKNLPKFAFPYCSYQSRFLVISLCILAIFQSSKISCSSSSVARLIHKIVCNISIHLNIFRAPAGPSIKHVPTVFRTQIIHKK